MLGVENQQLAASGFHSNNALILTSPNGRRNQMGGVTKQVDEKV